MDKVQKHISFNTNTPSSESYRNYVLLCFQNDRKTTSKFYYIKCITMLQKLQGKRKLEDIDVDGRVKLK
jgi:hypothetical protein